MDKKLTIPWSKPDLGAAERMAINHVFDSGWVTQGPETEAFERELEHYLGCKYAVVTCNGTAALAAVFIALNVKKLVLPSYAYPSLIPITTRLGIYVVFNDVDSETVHIFAGLPLNPRDWKGKIIEDAAEAFGSVSMGEKTGSRRTSIFSFHVAKAISTIEGGAITTNDDELALRLRQIRSRRDSNFQTTDINSAVGRVQLAKVRGYLNRRTEIAETYREELGGLVGFQEVPNHVGAHGNMMFPVFLRHPWRLAKELKRKGIETRLGWAPLICMAGAKRVSEQILCLPIYNTMGDEEVEYVINCVKKELS
jgi:perosamine synthetase